jgi:hypothetical protein
LAEGDLPFGSATGVRAWPPFLPALSETESRETFV